MFEIPLFPRRMSSHLVVRVQRQHSQGRCCPGAERCNMGFWSPSGACRRAWRTVELCVIERQSGRRMSMGKWDGSRRDKESTVKGSTCEPEKIRPTPLQLDHVSNTTNRDRPCFDGDAVLNASPLPCTHPTPSAQLRVLLVASASLCFSSIPQKWMPGRQRNLSTGLSTPPSPNSPPLISPSLALPNHALRRLACSISTLNSSHTDSYTRRDCHWMDWRREMRTGWSSVFWEFSANES